MNKDFSTFADGSDCKECAALERKVEALKQRLAAAEARVTELTAQLALRLRAEGCDREELLKECIENRNKLAAAEASARFYARYYDGPSEALLGEADRKAFQWIERAEKAGGWPVTPSAKLKQLWDARIAKIERERDEAPARLAAAEAAARWCWREISCQTVHHSTRQQHEFNEPCPVLQGALKRWPFLGEAAKGGRDERATDM